MRVYGAHRADVPIQGTWGWYMWSTRGLQGPAMSYGSPPFSTQHGRIPLGHLSRPTALQHRPLPLPPTRDAGTKHRGCPQECYVSQGGVAMTPTRPPKTGHSAPRGSLTPKAHVHLSVTLKMSYPLGHPFSLPPTNHPASGRGPERGHPHQRRDPALLGQNGPYSHAGLAPLRWLLMAPDHTHHCSLVARCAGGRPTLAHSTIQSRQK